MPELLLSSFYRRCALQAELFDRLPPHLKFLGFARDGHRKLVHEFEVARDLVMAHLALTDKAYYQTYFAFLPLIEV